MGSRQITAFAVAPLPVLVPLLIAIFVKALAGNAGDAGAGGVFLAMLAFALFGYAATLVIGVPIHLILRRFHEVNLAAYLSLAVLPFVFAAGAIAIWRRLTPPPGPEINPFGLYMQSGLAIKWTLVFAALAALSATTFWYAGVREPRS